MDTTRYEYDVCQEEKKNKEKGCDFFFPRVKVCRKWEKGIHLQFTCLEERTGSLLLVGDDPSQEKEDA